jgi:hypothetical protein
MRNKEAIARDISEQKKAIFMHQCKDVWSDNDFKLAHRMSNDLQTLQREYDLVAFGRNP